MIISLIIVFLLGNSGSLGISVFAEPSIVEMTPSGVPLQNLEKEIDKFISPFVGKSVPGAAIVVTKNNKIIFSKGYGYGNIADKTAVDPANTIFEYGSINKTFVWTAVMQLVEQGKMKLDQDIKNYLPASFASKLKYDKPITLLDIMNHTAGFEEYTFEVVTSLPKELISLPEALLASEPNQTYKPGSVISYSNFATSLAAYAVEYVSKETFSKYETNHILKPLGMEHTSPLSSMEDHSALAKNKATGYAKSGDGKFEPVDWTYIHLYPSGGMNGTAEDLAKFAMSLATTDSTPLFSKQDTLHTMFTQSYKVHGGMKTVAHGFWELSTKPHVLGHDGNTLSFSSNLAIAPEDKLSVVVLTNLESESKITTGIVNLIYGEDLQETDHNYKETDLPAINDIAGHYTFARNSSSTIHETLSYLTPIEVIVNEDNELILNIKGVSATYKQVEPYLFQLKQSKYESFKDMMPLLYVDKQQGEIIKLSYGKYKDIIPVKAKRTPVILGIYSVLSIISLLFFLVAPILLAIWYLIKKIRNAQVKITHPWSIALMLSGTALSVNSLYVLLRSVTDPFLTATEINFSIKINWGLSIISIVFLALTLFKTRKSNKSNLNHNKLLVVFLTTNIVLIITLLVILIDWNFFHLVP